MVGKLDEAFLGKGKLICYNCKQIVLFSREIKERIFYVKLVEKHFVNE